MACGVWSGLVDYGGWLGALGDRLEWAGSAGRVFGLTRRVGRHNAEIGCLCVGFGGDFGRLGVGFRARERRLGSDWGGG